MNERIKELAKNYLVYEHFSRYGECVEEEQYEFYPDELEQFVKLIVREMTDVFDQRAKPGTGFYEPHEPAELIREHFGVKP
jgi:hypothetical protein